MEPIQNSGHTIKLPIIVAFALATGLLAGAALFGERTGNAIFQENYSKLKEVLGLIQSEYVDSVNTAELTDVAISKMLERLDPHTVYIPAAELELAKAPLEGDFEGIGIEFLILDDTIEVITPLAGGPSESKGILAGDKIIKVNQKKVAGVQITNKEVFALLRGKRGSPVKISILRKGRNKLLEFNIIRSKIPTHSVEVAYLINKETGFIKVSRFSATTFIEFKEKMTALKKAGMKKLILDLRDNPGGYMDRATKMADEFLSGEKLIVYTEGKLAKYDQKVYAEVDGEFEKGPVIILINEGTASASEIVSGALQDNDRALIIGRRSFGKGLVQMPIALKDGSELRLTISRYYTPSGRSIQRPYGKDEAEYFDDYEKRYLHGELFSSDSIHFDDSLEFETQTGRKVYGGGGIMPDIFIPLDTGKQAIFINQLNEKNVFRTFALSYVNQNRARFKAMRFATFNNTFEVTPQILQAFVARAAKNKMNIPAKVLAENEKQLRILIKAHIANVVWQNEGFFPVFNQQDDMVMKALKLFDKAEKLEKAALEKSLKQNKNLSQQFNTPYNKQILWHST